MRRLFLALPVLLAACAAPPAPAPQPVSTTLRPFPRTDQFLQCVPFARQVSGVEIFGDAWTWWDQAEGRYARGREPRPGAVLVFKKTPRLPLGHVSVVVSVTGPRSILVTHANWGSDGRTRGVVHERQPVTDVSPANDWSQLRLMNVAGEMGKVYDSWGFIYPTPPAQAGM